MYKIFFIVSLLTIITLTSNSTTHAAWQIDLEVYTADNKADTGNASSNLSLGTTTNTTEGYDNKFDTIALLSDQVNAYFYHPEYKANTQQLWRDFRGEVLPKEWEFEVQSAKTDKPINIKWTIETTDNLHFILLDKDTGNEIDMASVNEFAYNSGSTTPRKFLLKVSDNNTTSTNNSNVISVGGDNGSGNAGAKGGGGCGYIKDIGNKDRNTRGQITLNMIIIILPLLLPLQSYIRQNVFAITKK